jgi:hypothetical protein
MCVPLGWVNGAKKIRQQTVGSGIDTGAMLDER